MCWPWHKKGAFLRHRATLKLSIYRWFFPWNKPTSHWGTPILGQLHISLRKNTCFAARAPLNHQTMISWRSKKRFLRISQGGNHGFKDANKRHTRFDWKSGILSCIGEASFPLLKLQYFADFGVYTMVYSLRTQIIKNKVWEWSPQFGPKYQL